MTRLNTLGTSVGQGTLCYWPACLLGAGLLVFAASYGSGILSGWCNDEIAHIPAGLYHLETGGMDAYRVNPPLPRMIAAIPLLVDRPQIDWFRSETPRVRTEYQFAHRWVTDNACDMLRYLVPTRLTVLFFWGIGLWAIVRWTRQLYGSTAAWTSALLWTISPDVIANATVVAPDLPAASAGTVVGYCFWNWLRRDERPFPWGVAATLALAIRV